MAPNQEKSMQCASEIKISSENLLKFLQFSCHRILESFWDNLLLLIKKPLMMIISFFNFWRCIAIQFIILFHCTLTYFVSHKSFQNGSHRCHCRDGFRSDPDDSSRCIDVDECKDLTHSCQQVRPIFTLYSMFLDNCDPSNRVNSFGSILTTFEVSNIFWGSVWKWKAWDVNLFLSNAKFNDG